jgi:Domain of unknown function (DUF4873)
MTESAHPESGHPEEGYDGPAQLFVGEGPTTLDVSVTLRGTFQPIDGAYHWYGRITRNDELDDVVRSGGSAVLRTPEGEATGRLSDRDPWGRYRIAATGVPPFERDA